MDRVVVSLSRGVMVSVAVRILVAVACIGVFTIAKGVCVETSIGVTWADCVAALQPASTSTDNTCKYLFTFNLICSFLIFSTIIQIE